jgi:uncharacterized membrane protein YbhN (UPF0104 family)
LGAFLHAVGVFLHHLEEVKWSALGLALACHVIKLVFRARAWQNIVRASYPEGRLRFLSAFGAYVAGVGVNSIAPARGGDLIKLYLVKHRVQDARYPTLAATLVVETLFDAVVGLALLFWAIHLGVLPSIHSLPNLPSIDWSWPARHPRVTEIAALVIGIAVGVLLVIATRRIQAFWRRVAQGFAILRRPTEYLRRVVTWQALSWALRLATVYYMLRAFHVPATVHNALLVQIAQSLSTLLPITPGGAGTEQGLLLYLFGEKVSRTAVLSFSVGMHIAIVVVNLGAGVVAVALLTRSFRLRKLEREALGDPERAEIRDGVAGTPAP